MRNDERTLIELTQRWERNRHTREVAGIPEPEDEPEAQPLSKNEIRNMLKRDRAPKGDK